MVRKLQHQRTQVLSLTRSLPKLITISLSSQNLSVLIRIISPTEVPLQQEAKCQYLAMLVRNKLMLAKAEIDSVMVLDAEVDLNTQNRMDMILSQSGKTVDELEALYGKTMEQVRLELRDQIREQMIVGKMEDEMTKDVEGNSIGCETVF